MKAFPLSLPVDSMLVLLQRHEQILQLQDIFLRMKLSQVILGLTHPLKKLPPSNSDSTPLGFRPPLSGKQNKRRKKNKQLHLSAKACCNPPPTHGPSSLRSCNVNRLRALQEVVCLLIGRIPAVCRSVLSSGRPCGSSPQRKRERCGGMRANDCPATAAPLRPTLSAHHPQTKCSCVTSSQRGSRRDLQEFSFALAACL